ncbi:MAG TPA: hypothetical protein PLF96_13185, partial [Thermotogota bacterium]|nr:hypothetical protein [Thermotogota bacterium]
MNYRNPIDEFSGNGGGDFQEEYPGNVFSVPVFLLPPLVSPPNTRSLSVDSQEAGVQFRFSVEGQEETTPFSGNWEENDTVSLSLGSSQYKDQDGIVEGNDVLYSVGWRDGAPLSRTETMNVDKDLGIVANQVKYKVERGVEGIPESAASISWPSEWVFEGSYQSFQVLDTVVEVGGTDFGFKKWILSYEGGETYDTSASMGRSINRPVKVVALFEPLEAVDNPTSYITVNISSGFLNPSSATLPRYSLYKVLGSVGVPYSGVDAYVEDYIEDGNTLFLGTFDGEPGRDFNLKPGEVYFLFAPELVEEGVRHMNTGVEINGEQGLGHWGSYHVLYAGDSGHTQIEDLHHNDTVKNLFTETLEYYVTFETYPSNVGSLSKGNGWYETLDKWGNSDEVRVYADDDGDWVLDHWEVNGLSYFRGHNYSMFPGNIEVDSSGGLNIEVVYEPTQVIGVYRYEPTFELTFSRGIKEPENFPGINLTGAFELVLNGESQQGPISHVVEEYGDLEITVPKQLEMEVTSVFSGPDTRFDIDYLYEFADTTYQVPELSNSQFLDDRFCFQLNNILADGSFSFLYNPCFAFQQTTVPAGLQPYQTLAELQVPRSYYLGGIEALSREMPMYAQNESTQQLYRYRETLIQDIQGVRVESERNFEIQPGISPTKVEGRFDPVYPFSLVSEPFSGLELDLYRDGVWLEKITTPVEKILGEGSWRFQGPKEIQGDYTDWVEGNDILLLFATGTNLEEFSYSSGGDTLTFSWVPLENDQKTYSQQLEYEVYLKVCQEDNVGSPQHEQWILANSVMTRTPVPVEG